MVKNFCSSGNPLRDRKSLDSSIISRIEFADFLPGEATTNRRAELDEIYAAHEGCLDSVGIDRPLDFLVNPLDAVAEVTRLCQHHALMQPIGGQSSKYGSSSKFA